MDIHFLRPAWFLALPLLGLLLWLLWRQAVSSRAWGAVCDPELLPHLLVGEQGAVRRWPVLAVGMAGLLAILALAGPAWEKREQPVFREQSALVLALDLSRSMDAADIKPSRLARARHKIMDILQQRREGQTALIVYAAAPFTVTPLTDDRATIAAQVNSLKTGLMPSQGSRPDLAVAKAAQLLQQAGHARGDILLLTDGLEPVAVEKILAARDGQNHRISVLAIGTEEGAPIPLAGGGFLKNATGEIVLPRLEPRGLRRLAHSSGGRFHALSADDSDIQYLLAPLKGRRSADMDKERGLTTDQWREEGPWLLLLVLPLAALAFRRGCLAIALLFLLPPPPAAQALDWQGLWARPDQRASRALEQGDARAAAQLFENREWKAAALYRAGEYQQAAEALEGIQSPDALYNKGNALARAGRLPEAIQAYDAALEMAPDHADARYNRDLVRQQMRQQQQSSGQEQKKSGQEEDRQDRPGQQDNPGEQDRQQEGEQTGQSGEQGEESRPGQQEHSPSPGADEEQQAHSRQEQEEEAAGAGQKPGDSGDDQQEESQAASADELPQQNSKSDPVTEQWLRRIPDDPGGLLRRKFRYQYQQQRQPPREAQQW